MEALLAGATSLLGAVELVDDLSFSHRASVARLRVGDGSTVVVKRPVASDALAREVEAMRTLPERVRPALVATGEGIVVMEDLGAGPSLADLLLGDDAGATDVALLAWATTLGAALRPTLRSGPGQEPEALTEELEELRGLADALGATVPGGVDDDVALVASTLSQPGPWLAFCPGDTCPDNNRVLADGSVRLFDFEGSGWRHAAMEAAYCRAPFCTCWCLARLPAGVTQRMEAAFLAALSPPDVDRFADVIALAAVRYTLESLRWFRRYVVEDRPVGPEGRAPSTGRQYLYERLRAVAGQHGRLPALADVAGQLADRMRARWPGTADMPLYPAYRARPGRRDSGSDCS